jgi:hypothetical protein
MQKLQFDIWLAAKDWNDFQSCFYTNLMTQAGQQDFIQRNYEFWRFLKNQTDRDYWSFSALIFSEIYPISHCAWEGNEVKTILSAVVSLGSALSNPVT